MALHQLIKKRAENKRITINISNANSHTQTAKNSANGQLQTPELSQFCSNHSAIQSALPRKKSQKKNHIFIKQSYRRKIQQTSSK